MTHQENLISMKFKGTPGPWKVKHSQSKPAFNVVGSAVGGRYKISRCPYIVSSDLSEEWINREIDEAKANAQLIAHAPQMLEMLQSVVDLQANHYGNGIDTHLALIRKAAEIRELIKSATTV